MDQPPTRPNVEKMNLLVLQPRPRLWCCMITAVHSHHRSTDNNALELFVWICWSFVKDYNVLRRSEYLRGCPMPGCLPLLRDHLPPQGLPVHSSLWSVRHDGPTTSKAVTCPASWARPVSNALFVWRLQKHSVFECLP